MFTETLVQERFGIHPSRFLEYKALVGDKTDNIDGIKGIGPKNAVKVLNGERELTEEEREVFERNRSLIELDAGIELPHSLNQLSFTNKLEDFKAFEFLQRIGIL